METAVAHEHPAAAPRALVPREHGAWGQLGFPLVTALVLARARPAALALALAALAVFFAHEPLLVLLGQRGPRAQGELGPRARRAFVMAAAAAVLAGVPGLLLAPAAARWAALVPLALAVPVAALIAQGRERSTPGEVLAALTLAAAGLPVALAGGVTWRTALESWLIWSAGLVVATLAVRSVIATARARRKVFMAHYGLVLTVLLLGLATLLAAHGHVTWVVPVALVPAGLLSLGLFLVPPRPTRLKTVGWAYIAASTATTLALTLGPR